MNVRIGLAFGAFPFSGLGGFWRWVDACEDSGVDSIFLPDRIVGRVAPPETLTTLAAVAGRTRRLKVGMAVLVLPARDPVLLAKECATIDFLSEGRLLPMFGVAEGNVPEWAAMGIDPRTRGRRANEMLDVMTQLWERDHVDYEGKMYTLRDVSITPRPRQAPLPFWIGGRSQAAIERTARYGHGWLGGSTSIPDEVGRIVAGIKARALELGRTIDSDHYGAGFNFRFGSLDEPIVQRAIETNRARIGASDPGRFLAVGDADTIRERLDTFVQQGISKFVIRPIADGDDDMMEQTRRLSSEVISQVQD